MTVKSLAAGVLAGVLCVSCGQNDPSATGGQSRGGGKTLAGAADTSKAGKKGAASSSRAELRLPEAPARRPVDAAGERAPAGASPTVPTRIAVEPAAPANGGGGGAVADASDVPPAPKEAQWTLYCATIASPDHVAVARDLKEKLVKETGMREWYIVHESSQSRMYYGYYRSISDKSDAAETARAQADRKKIDGLTLGNQRPFNQSQFVQLAAPDPEAPPQWNIVNAPPEKVWTLIVAGYKDHPDRKRAAVETVRDMRAAGEEAYYYHGDNVSNVLIGTWPDDAVVEERVDETNGASTIRDAVFVLPAGVQAPRRMRTKEGKGVRVVGQRFAIADPTLQAKVKQYPRFAMNGEDIIYTKNGKSWPEPTQVTVIPRPEERMFRDAPDEGDVGPGGLASDGRGPDRPAQDTRPGYDGGAAARDRQPSSGKGASGNTGGRLRSIGD